MRTRASVFFIVILVGLISTLVGQASSISQASGYLQATPTPLAPTPEPTPIPNNISLNSYGEGSLAFGVVDVWQFTAESNTTVTITLNSIQFDAYVELYSPGDSVRAFAQDDDSGRGTNAQIQAIVLPITGIYEIHVHALNDSGRGLYRLHLEEDTMLGALPDARIPVIYGAIEQGEMVDYEPMYAFTGQAEDIVTILLYSDDFDTFLTLTDSDGNILGENDDATLNATHSALVNIVLPTEGTYYIFPSAYQDMPRGAFRLELYNTTEITEASGGEMAIGEVIEGMLTPHSFADWRFMGVEGQIISLAAMTNPPGGRYNLSLELYGPDGELVDADDDSGLLFNPSMTGIQLPMDGEYRLRVQETIPLIGGGYYLSVVEGIAYFSPYGTAAPTIRLQNGFGATPMRLLERQFDLWVLEDITEAPITITLTLNGEGATVDDFVLRIADTDWEFLADSDNGILVLETLSEFSDDYLILVEYQGEIPANYQLTLQSGDAIAPTSTHTDAPPPTTVSADNQLVVGQPVEDDLGNTTEATWLFVVPADAEYTFTLVRIDGIYDPFLTVLDERGEIIATDDDSAGNFDAQIVLNLTAGQQVQLVVSSFAEQSGGVYRLSVERN